jgi:hypothetical protein
LNLATAAAALTATQAPPVMAQEFRIETKVFIGDEETPASQTVTLFEKSAVYEFVENPPQIIVYRDGGQNKPAQFILLDPTHQKRTDVDVERVEGLMDKLTRWAAEHKDPLLKFAAHPVFEETFAEKTGSLTLASPDWTYAVATVEAEDAAALARYRDFTDRFAQLSSMLYNSPPPGPRLALNAALARHGVVPVEIQRTTSGDAKNGVRATHVYLWRLSRDDRAQLDEAQAYLANFEKVDNEKFMAASGEKDKTIVRGQSR